MNKKITLLALSSIFAVASVQATELTGGLEIDNKFSADQVEDKGTGVKLFAGYEGFGVSAKRNDTKVKEYNLNYTHNFENFFVKGEYEYVDNRSRVDANGVSDMGSDVNKFGITAGTNVMDMFDTSLRLRKDLAAKEMGGKKSDITRFDLAAGKQFENVYFNTKLVGMHENDANSVDTAKGGKDTVYNVEARLTFNNIAGGFVPYFEAGNEGSHQNDKRNTYGKVGVVLNF
ncbi:hypothetical protein [Vibrio sinaloensis]|uniref:hypothetical protein n=1 Tax=Photobacterium sp. (strain ATCC 43367) TaxID=379097 RepID=UPI0020683749|nr:hypothetical protein [Vibrio sinaloensis]UPQ90095.1 hypothetical protein MTO69_15155 [Vibrio sinaloensis]